MKILFAVSNDRISESIVKRYQKEYKEIVTYKNVYYFKSILNEIQKDKTYDRIIVSEELEDFANTQIEKIDKIIYEKLENISDEASNLNGEIIPIILITSDRRKKGEEILAKIFELGIYDALIGSDRSTDAVCRLIRAPRSKKEAKEYYKIQDGENKNFIQSENGVSEQEIQNILAHYKKLGKNEEKYVTSFDNIVTQYNDAQLRIISKFLPLNVRAVLEEKSPKYKQIMAYGNTARKEISKTKNVKIAEPTSIPNGKLLKTNNKNSIPRDSIIIPSAVNKTNVKKLARKSDNVINNTNMQNNNIEKVNNPNISNQDKLEQIENISQELNLVNENIIQEPKRGRGRPRKVIPEEEKIKNIQEQPKRRGRPRKNPIVQEEISSNSENDNAVLSGFENLDNNDAVLPGFENLDNNDTVLPGFENLDNNDTVLPGFENLDNNDTVLPGFENIDNSNENQLDYENQNNDDISSNNLTLEEFDGFNNTISENENINNYENSETITGDAILPGFENINLSQDDNQDFNSLLPGFENVTSGYNVGVYSNDEFEKYSQKDNNNYNGFTNNDNSYTEYNNNSEYGEIQNDNNYDEYNNYENSNETILPGFESENNYESYDNTEYNNNNEYSNMQNDNNNYDEYNNYENNNETILPGFENEYNSQGYSNTANSNYSNDFNSYENSQNYGGYEELQNSNNNEEQYNPLNDLLSAPSTIGGVENGNYSVNENFSSNENNYDFQTNYDNNENNYNNTNNGYNNDYEQYNEQPVNNYSYNVDLSSILTSDKKIVAFVGTSKNGTSFIVNNLAEYASSVGINVAVLDATKNKNSYYIYTKNEEQLRQTAEHCLENLINGQANGISVNRNLTVYTSLPEDRENLNSAGAILETIVKNHKLVLIDCDFDTPYEYFSYAQEICLVQSLDILTIQPLTAFLRELKGHNVLDENKIKIILNKYVRVRGISEKTIIGGMSKYTDPAMSFMTDLFDINNATKSYMIVQFEPEIYTRYLESIIECDVSIKGYSKTFIQKLKEVCNWLYSNASGSSTYKPPAVPASYENTAFSASMNNTLNRMKKNMK